MAALENRDKDRTSEQPPSPVISLPKGGGAIRGIGEKFAANPVTGTGSMSVPIATSPGRSGFGPQLALSYDSGSGNGAFGFGWTLSLPSITRKTDRGLPQYRDAEESDVFILSGAEDLVPAFKPDTTQVDELERDGYRVRRYRPRIEGLFARIERWTNVADARNTFWRSISKDNVTTFYGRSGESRIADPSDPTRIFCWLICESYDDKGNAIVYEYQEENSDGIDLSQAHEKNRTVEGRKANRYLKRIQYGNRTPNRDSNWNATDPAQLVDWMFETVFDYEEGHYEALPPDAQGRQFIRAVVDKTRDWPVRPDSFSSYRAGFEVRTYRLCQRVLMFHHFPDELGTPDYLARSTDFTYNPSPIGSFITQVTQSGYVRQPDGTYLKKSLPALRLEYSEAVIHDEIESIDAESLQNLPIGTYGLQYQWLDLDGEGLQGVLSEQEEGWYYKRNLSPISVVKQNGKEKVVARFEPLTEVATEPSIAEGGGARYQFMDLAGDGNLDLVQFEKPLSGFFERTEDRQWEGFSPFRSTPNVAWGNPNLRFVDLTGDGHADILITEDDALTWYPSLAQEGFGPAIRIPQPRDEEEGPALVFADGTQAIFVADFSGDGLADIARIRNGEVCYWPNLGYGHFGARVTMDNSPRFDAPDQFDPKRIRLADIDGSGTTDIIYLERNRVAIYRNGCGNGWSPVEYLASFPAVDELSSVTAVDLLGNGTACLVWSSPLPGTSRHSMRYIDLMGGQKPHLLVSTVNNLGAETVIQYAPSTKFYLADRAAGKPWIMRLPFPVQVVQRIEVYDHISRNRFVTRFGYHHGYFDGVEREFRGFGMVEQWDTEEFAALNADPQLPPVTNIEEDSHVPPVLTRTWFHTGVRLGRDRVSNFFAGLSDDPDSGEYYREPGLTDDQAKQLLLDDSVLPLGLTPDEEREACRSLKGAMLRQEIYSLDGTDKERHPYSVTEQNFTIRALQPRGANPHAVFFSHPREALAYHYERIPTDPRVAHSLSLEVDGFGNVLQSAVVAYGRRQADPALEARDQQKQGELHILYSERRMTKAIDTADEYRPPLRSEAFVHEVTGLPLASGRQRFTFEEVLNAGASAAVIAYQQTPASGVLQKRLIDQVRTLYRRNDLSSALDIGVAESLALPFQSYRLAFTPGLLDIVYGPKVNESMLAQEGRYVHSQGDSQWWIPSARLFHSPNPGDDASVELTYARQHFFLPHRQQDPFGQTASVTYDAYDLLLIETRDALNNIITVGERDPAGNIVAKGNDYRVLQPRVMTDPNGNRAAVSFDALGIVVGTATMGKRNETPRQGDLLDNFVPDLADDVVAAHLANPFADPHAILAQATTRLVYDLFAYSRTKDQVQPSPAVVYTLVRETHDADLAPGEQTKVQHRFSYSDGFGREIQNKRQAEPGPVPKRDEQGSVILGADGQPEMTAEDVSPRWAGSGWTVFNNKGKPVKQFEPFFSDRHAFEFDVRIGVSSILMYDPPGRAVAKLRPDHSWEKIVFDPWRQEAWDVNDTALIDDPKSDPDVGPFFRRLQNSQYLPTWYDARQGGALGPEEQNAAAKTRMHAGTPGVRYADSLGRTILTISHNRFMPRDASPTDPPVEEFYGARVLYDIQGNQREVIDAKGRTVIRCDYDMLGMSLHHIDMEAGERWVLNDVAGLTVRAWDSRGHAFRTAYDALRRPVRGFVQGIDSVDPGTEILVAKTEYGEGQPNDMELNLRTKAFRQYDNAGIGTNEAYDFKGNLLRTTRQLVTDYTTIPDWSANPALEHERFVHAATYDAVNRALDITAADGSVYRNTFNEANLLEKVDVTLQGVGTPTAFVTNIDYNAKGQRLGVDYGNQLTTEYTYDPFTSRTKSIKTSRSTDQTWLQDLAYTYDAAGNITHIQDGAQQTIYFKGQVVTPSNDYTYDAIYRLIAADGREHIGQAAQPQTTWDDQFRIGLPHPNDGQAMRRYTEWYDYDAAGNLLHLVHQAANGNWTRTYSYNEPSLIQPGENNNRLSSTMVGDNLTPESYGYDAHGNMTRMPHLSLMKWDYRDRLHAASQQVVNEGAPETTRFFYDDLGTRMRKVTTRQNGTRKNERMYLGGFEVYREFDATGTTVTLERETLHVMDDQRRVALVETRTQGDDGSPPQLIRYQFGNHLGSASLEVDGAGQIISYEEYYPFGSTSYQAGRTAVEVQLKRYRFTGMERDEETGLEHHNARYYAPWLARWTSADPIGITAGVNLYTYCHNNPLLFVDANGQDPVSVGEAGDLPRDATLQDLRNYAKAHGKEYSDPNNERRYVETEKGGQWVGGILKDRVYDPQAEADTGFGNEPSNISYASNTGTVSSGSYSTNSNSGDDYDPFAPKQPKKSGGSGSSKKQGKTQGKAGSASGGSPTGSPTGTAAQSGGSEPSPNTTGVPGGTGTEGTGTGSDHHSSWLETLVSVIATVALVLTVVGTTAIAVRIGMAALRFGFAYAATVTAPTELTAVGLGMAGYTVPRAAGVGGGGGGAGLTGGGGGGPRIVSPVYHYDEWDIVIVETSVGRQGFYRSTGMRSGMPDRWLPFDEIYEWTLDRAKGWVNKDAYTLGFGRGNPLHRFGSDEFRAISDALTQQNIPRSTFNLMDEAHVNSILDFFKARTNPDNRFRPTPDFRGQ